mmetsp:Transcript_39814/g.40600  ORF Transcript_39814/g.40600 Transcript_39814/m.40600 type:complete len:118 (-) Transcript_39814:419-772(-)
MFLSQALPIVGMLYFLPCCNDLTRFLAQRGLSFWCVSAVLIGQYLEWTHYGGRGRSHRAGRCNRVTLAELAQEASHTLSRRRKPRYLQAHPHGEGSQEREREREKIEVIPDNMSGKT